MLQFNQTIGPLLKIVGKMLNDFLNFLILYFILTIMFSIIGLLCAFNFFVAIFLILLTLIFYFKLSKKAFYLMTVWSLSYITLIYFLKEKVLIISIFIFVVSWVTQFIGHLIEGRKPSFFEDIKYLLIGPLFVFNSIFVKFGWKWWAYFRCNYLFIKPSISTTLICLKLIIKIHHSY